MQVKKFLMDNSEIRIDKWLHMQLPEFSRNQIANFIKEEKVYLGQGQKLKASDVLSQGSEIFFKYPQVTDNTLPQAQKINLNIVYEDEDFIVVNKPVDLAVHPGSGNPDGTLVNALLNHTDQLSSYNGLDRPGIVHRLDKDTSGLLLVCKNDEIHEVMAKLFKKHKVLRLYRALVWGIPEVSEGRINARIGRHPNKRIEMAVVPSGKKAITDYQLLEYFTNKNNQPIASELELSLYTGRTHQIRVHLNHLNLPIIGDPVYHKGRNNLGLKVQALYSSELAFQHPFTGQEMQFVITAPDYYTNIKKRLKSHLIDG